MKSTFIFILFFIFLSISVSGQAPIPLTAMARSANPLMTIQTNSSRYQNYQYFTTAWGDTLLNFMQANPNWLGTYLPAGAVNIAAAGNNLQFTQGGTLRWTSDTTSLGEWIPQFTVSPALSGGLINQRLIGVGSLANRYIGTSGQDNVGLYVDGYPDLYLRNQQVQDTALAVGTYYPSVDEEGRVIFGQSGIFAVQDSQIVSAGISTYRDSASGTFGFGEFNDPLTVFDAYDKGFLLSEQDEAATMRYGAAAVWAYDQAVQLTSDASKFFNKSDIITFTNPSNSGCSFTTRGATVNRQWGISNGNLLSSGFPTSPIDSGMFFRENYSATSFVPFGIEALGDNSLDAVFFYDDKYRLANNTPTATSGVKSLHTWTGNGTNTTPAMETMPSLFSALSAQNTGDQILTTAVNNTFIFDNISFTSGSSITLTNDTLINFLALGVYEISLDGRFEASASPEPTAVQFVQQGVGIADLGANFLFSIATDDQITPFKRIFEVTALPAAVYIINEATTWASGSVLFSATSSLNVKRLY